jgi:hypothetical protein
MVVTGICDHIMVLKDENIAHTTFPAFLEADCTGFVSDGHKQHVHTLKQCSELSKTDNRQKVT